MKSACHALLQKRSNDCVRLRRFPRAPVGPRRVAFTVLELLTVVAILAILLGLLLSAVQRVRGASARLRCLNNLRQIGLAAQHYHDVNGAYPHGVTRKLPSEPFPYMGWHARILPFIEQDAVWRDAKAAYERNPDPFRGPPHPGLSTVIRLFVCPTDNRVHEPQLSFGFLVALTSYLGVEGRNLQTQDGVLFVGSDVRASHIKDGASNTILIGERPPSADLFFGWWYAGVGQNETGSCDMVLGSRELNVSGGYLAACPKGPYAFVAGRISDPCDQFHFWSLHAGGANFAFVDGSARFLTYGADSILPALSTRAGGEAVSIE